MTFSGLSLPELLRQAASALGDTDLSNILLHAADSVEEPRELRIMLSGENPNAVLIDVEDKNGNSISPAFTIPAKDGVWGVVFTEMP